MAEGNNGESESEKPGRHYNEPDEKLTVVSYTDLADCPEHPWSSVTLHYIAGDAAALTCDECGREL